MNVRVQDNVERRMRGGSRPGLTKLVADDFGDNISDIASLATSSTTGTSELLVVLVDSSLKVLQNGTVSTPIANLTTAGGENITDAMGDVITVSSATAPSSAFLLTANQKVYAVSGSSIIEWDPKTGLTRPLPATAGTVPSGSTFGAIYRDRLFLSGADNAIYVSKQRDFSNWDFGQYFESVSRPVVFQLSIASEVGPTPTAMIPYDDRTMILAGQRTLWLIEVDPAVGSLRLISQHI